MKINEQLPKTLMTWRKGCFLVFFVYKSFSGKGGQHALTNGKFQQGDENNKKNQIEILESDNIYEFLPQAYQQTGHSKRKISELEDRSI